MSSEQKPRQPQDNIDTPPEYEVSLDELVENHGVIHNWVRRGDKLSCEGANHPHHSHFLIKKH